MAYFSEESQQNLGMAHPIIRRVCNEVIDVVDITIGETWRTREKHQEYLNHDPPRTKVTYEETYHSCTDGDGNPRSQAVHILPYPELWDASKERWYYVGGVTVGLAKFIVPAGWKWVWGGDWDGDDIFSDNEFDDLAHHEIRNIS